MNLMKWQPLIPAPQPFGTLNLHTWEGAFSFAILQTIFIHSEQATGFANSFQVEFVAIPRGDNKASIATIWF